VIENAHCGCLRGHTASAVELKLTVLDSLCPTEQRQESTDCVEKLLDRDAGR
jgi:hypothetical protein